MANWKPKTGQLRDVVTIYERAKTKNSAGFAEVVWRPLLLCRAAVDTWSGGITLQDDADTAQQRIRVRIRWRDGIREGLYVEHRGQRYEVTWVDRYDMRRDYLCLECRATETARA